MLLFTRAAGIGAGLLIGTAVVSVLPLNPWFSLAARPAELAGKIWHFAWLLVGVAGLVALPLTNPPGRSPRGRAPRWLYVAAVPGALIAFWEGTTRSRTDIASRTLFRSVHPDSVFIHFLLIGALVVVGFAVPWRRVGCGLVAAAVLGIAGEFAFQGADAVSGGNIARLFFTALATLLVAPLPALRAVVVSKRIPRTG
jgi:hypothetical protein